MLFVHQTNGLPPNDSDFTNLTVLGTVNQYKHYPGVDFKHSLWFQTHTTICKMRLAGRILNGMIKSIPVQRKERVIRIAMITG